MYDYVYGKMVNLINSPVRTCVLSALLPGELVELYSSSILFSIFFYTPKNEIDENVLRSKCENFQTLLELCESLYYLPLTDLKVLL